MEGKTFYEFFPPQVDSFRQMSWLTSTQELVNGYYVLPIRACVILKENMYNSAPPPTM